MRSYDSDNLRHRRQIVTQIAIENRLARKRSRRIRRQHRQEQRAGSAWSGRRVMVIVLSLITGIAVDPSHPYGVLVAFACMGVALIAVAGAER